MRNFIKRRCKRHSVSKKRRVVLHTRCVVLSSKQRILFHSVKTELQLMLPDVQLRKRGALCAPLGRSSARVVFLVVALRKRLATVLTQERFLTSVNAVVAIAIRLVLEAKTTRLMRTFVKFVREMRMLMLAHRFECAKDLWTATTCTLELALFGTLPPA